MTQTLQEKISLSHNLTGLPTRDLLYSDVLTYPKGDLHILLFTIADFPYPNLELPKGDQLIINLSELLMKTLPEKACLYQWRDFSFAVLIPYYDKDFVKRWEDEVLSKANKIILPPNVLCKFRLKSVIVSSPPISRNNLLHVAELELQAKQQSINNFYAYPIKAYTAKAKEYTNFALARLWAKAPYYVYLHNASAAYAKEMAIDLGLDENAQANIVTSALWQDVAISEFPINILANPNPLDEYDWQQLKKHPIIGADLLKYLGIDEDIYKAVLHHHESWNATGYPDKLQGEDIPLNARILRIATDWAALQLPRPWRKAYTTAEALTIIKKASGIYYDPALIKKFRNIVNYLPKPQDLILSVP